MDKAAELRKLQEEIEARGDLPLMGSNLVFGDGNPDCAVMFIGEAPGVKEDEEKTPFKGRSGKLLDCMIDKIGWKRADVYITNIVKRRPPDSRNPQRNRHPSPEEVEAYKPYLKREIEIINPKIIVTLGRFAMNYFAPLKKMTCDRGKIFLATDGRTVFPLYHPGAALRSTKKKDVLRDDLMKLPKVLSGELAAEDAASRPFFEGRPINS